MEVKAWAIGIVAALGTCSLQPAIAKAGDCYDAEYFALQMQDSGFRVTFSDTTDQVKFYVMEDGTGQWVAYISINCMSCPISAGDAGIRYPLPPNA